MKLKFFSIFLFFCILINFNLVAADCKKPQMPSDAEWQNWLSGIKKEALDLGIEEYFYSKHWIFIEWPEKISTFLPNKVDKVHLRLNKNNFRALKLSVY